MTDFELVAIIVILTLVLLAGKLCGTQIWRLYVKI